MRLILSALVLFAASAAAQDRMEILTVRPGITTHVYVMKRDGAKAAVLLLTGGEGGLAVKNGIPTSGNFLVRSRELFAAQGFHVAVMSRPSDVADMKGDFRTSQTHMADLKHVLGFLKKEFGTPIWLVGTSRGTISATAAAIHLGAEHMAGIVLTSSIVGTDWDGFRPAGRDDGSQYAVPNQKLDAIRVPVLVFHHQKDACRFCVAAEVPRIERGLANAPVKKTIFVDGGEGAHGGVCDPFHWHGFIGMEKEAVAIIADWIRKPSGS